jgi:hypothetical protein
MQRVGAENSSGVLSWDFARVLRRQIGRPRFDPHDRAIITAFSRARN